MMSGFDTMLTLWTICYDSKHFFYQVRKCWATDWELNNPNSQRTAGNMTLLHMNSKPSSKYLDHS